MSKKKTTKKNYPPLREGGIYHIYNMGNNRENIFIEERNYEYFLRKLFQHGAKVFDIYAYCLMRNHFHLLVRVVTREEWEARVLMDIGVHVEQAFDPPHRLGDALNAYAKAVNKAYDRTGSLFRKPYRRKEITSDRQFMVAVRYIHRNPEHHGFVEDFRDWPWSSFGALYAMCPTVLNRADVHDWFGGRDNFDVVHTSRAQANA